MREILFRGKTEKGEWVQGTYYHQKEFYGDKTDIHYIIESCDQLEDNMMIFSGVIPETVGQYTGLTDKYGKKIFEGDIIKSDNGRISSISVVLYGKFEPKLFYDLIESYVRPRPTEKLYGLFAKSTEGDEMLLTECSHLFEVIGNIHDNPELLERSKGNDTRIKNTT